MLGVDESLDWQISGDDVVIQKSPNKYPILPFRTQRTGWMKDEKRDCKTDDVTYLHSLSLVKKSDRWIEPTTS